MSVFLLYGMILIEVYTVKEEELTQFATQFLRTNFHIDLSIPIVRNNRLRSSYGRYVMTNKQHPVRIEIAGKTLDYGTVEAIKGIIKHECIHYALHMQGQSMRDGHPVFEETLRQYNAPSTNTMKIGLFYLFRCEICVRTYETNRKQISKTPKKYRTKCCNGKITIMETRKYDGKHFSKVSHSFTC